MRPALAAALAAVALTLTACSSTPQSSVAECTKQIIAHPCGTNMNLWPACEHITHDQLVTATADAMAQGSIC